jgi:TRAP-type transport system small permease protein
MKLLLDRYCRVLEVACAFLMGCMVVLVFGNVVLRYCFSTGFLISEELSRWMFVWMVFIGAVVVMGERGHMGTDMVVARFPAWAQRLSLVVVQVCMLYITWLMLRGSWSQVVINGETNAPVSGLPVSIFYFSGVLFAVSVLIILAYQLWLNVSGKLVGKELVMVQESEEAAHLVLDSTSDAAAPAVAAGRK